jgi:hypothetical protein
MTGSRRSLLSIRARRTTKEIIEHRATCRGSMSGNMIPTRVRRGRSIVDGQLKRTYFDLGDTPLSRIGAVT